MAGSRSMVAEPPPNEEKIRSLPLRVTPSCGTALLSDVRRADVNPRSRNSGWPELLMASTWSSVPRLMPKSVNTRFSRVLSCVGEAQNMEPWALVVRMELLGVVFGVSVRPLNVSDPPAATSSHTSPVPAALTLR